MASRISQRPNENEPGILGAELGGGWEGWTSRGIQKRELEYARGQLNISDRCRRGWGDVLKPKT